MSNNYIFNKNLEEDKFITLDEKAEKLLKNITKPKYLHALKLLFENPLNKFTPKVLRDSLVALADPQSFDYYDEQSVIRLELHLRTWVAVLEQICFTKMRLSKDLRDRIYNSLSKFAEIHRRTTQVTQEGFDNNYTSKFDQLQISENENIIKKRNYNIDFLLIHLRDTLHSLRDDETWFQEIIRRIKELLKTALNITPGILSVTGVTLPNDNCSILSLLTKVRQSLSFKYPVASYYVDWRIMLIIQHNLFTWSESSEMLISKKYCELVLMEYLWSFLEREWINVTDKSILDSQTKFEEVSNKVSKALKNTGSFLNDFAGNEPLALPHTLWFGILDLAQNLIQKTTRISIYGLCYYLAIESLNKAPNSFIQFKASEILLHLYNIDNQMFSMIEIDFKQYIQQLNENKLESFSEKFKNLLIFIKEKYLEEIKILSEYVGKENKGKGKEKSINQSNILDVIASEITCPISREPMDQLCILKCQHMLSLNNLKKLKQKICPKCRKEIKENDVRYLPQNSIYKNLYTKFYESGNILPSIELNNSGQNINNQYDSDDDSSNSEVDHILTKKKKFMNSITKLNLNISLLSILPRISKKQHPIYKNILKELEGKHYEKAESLCKEFLKFFPKSYSLRCILAFIYRCLKDYEQAHLYLEEAINLKLKEPIAYLIRGEIFFRQNKYEKAAINLESSLDFSNDKINNLEIMLGNSYLFYNNYNYALMYYKFALENDPNNYLCLKNCAYGYEKKEDYLNALKILDKLLNVNKKDSLILCYYGEILYNMRQFSKAVICFTKTNIIDPENIHNLNKRAIAYYILQEYDKVLSDLDKVIQLDPLNNLAYYLKSLTYYTKKDINNAMITFKKFTEIFLNSDNNILAKIQLFHLESLLNKNRSVELHNILTKINQIPNIEDNKLLLLIRCKMYIKLKKYNEAKLDFDDIFDYSIYDKYENISYIYSLRECSGYWSFIQKIHYKDEKLGITKAFKKYMYKGMKILKLYFNW
jgi:tetratricopeptide (TPR) repeat protein